MKHDVFLEYICATVPRVFHFYIISYYLIGFQLEQKLLAEVEAILD